MDWRVEIEENEEALDVAGLSVQKDLVDLGIKHAVNVRVVHVYHITGEISEPDIKTICNDLLVDKITQFNRYVNSKDYQCPQLTEEKRIVEIAYHPGVMDPVEESTIKGIKDLGVKGVTAVRTSKQYHLFGKISDKELSTIIDKVLANKLIQHVVQSEPPQTVLPPALPSQSRFQIQIVELLKANEKKLLQVSQQGQLFLNRQEMRAIQNHFKKIGRNPTDCELETIAQTWSEHCYHKTFRGMIRYTSFEKGRTKTQLIRNLLKSTIMKATLTIKKPWCISVFHDNAGVIKFDEQTNVCFKVETHNHPSALEPFGGANTGVGGVIRDILGTGLGAKPICNTDVFCFAEPDFPADQLPSGTLHPKRVMKGVVSGVRDYGNKMGIPTVNGSILFDNRFVGNPLVYCGNVGLLPKGMEKKEAHKGDLIVVVGGRTGRDGIHGATFSSGELTEESEVVSSGAVQIGHPIQEKKVLDALMQARDQKLYCAITDCGAGGLSSAVGEMGKDLGARVELEKVPLKYQGLKYTEIWISESQERMVLAVPKKNIDALIKVFSDENVEATVIGEFTGSKRLELCFHDCQVCDLDMEFLHDGIPGITKNAQWKQAKHKDPRFPCPEDLTPKLFESLSHYNVCSKESVIRQYDHEVQGQSVVKPLAGINCDGPSDACVLLPKLDSRRGIAIANGINFRYGMIDPFWMAASCIDESIRQIIAVGGDMDRIAILDNFCWGNPDKPDRLGGLVRAALGCYKIATGYRVPFISGKDSLYNEYAQGKKTTAIPGTLLISSIGIIEDVRKTVTMDFKKAGHLIYAVGRTFDEMGGSIYLDTYGLTGNSVPRVNTVLGTKIFSQLTKAVQKGLIQAMHDCSEGGLAVALAEMAFAGDLGANIELARVPYSGKDKRNDTILFSESNSRFLIEVAPHDQKQIEKMFQGLPLSYVGWVKESPLLKVQGLDESMCIEADIHELKEAWQKPLRG